MLINERLDRLGENPFTRLNALLAPITPRANERPVLLSVGEPQHAPPAFLAETITANGDLWNRYPPVTGTDEYRLAVTQWLTRRYRLKPGALDPARHALILCGTKEGLYLATQLAVPQVETGRKPVVLLPNPFYLVYRGAAAMAGAEIQPMPATRATGFLPDFDAIPPATLERTSLAFLCSPANPQGAVAGLDYLKRAILLAREYDFILVVDECYSEIWDKAPPVGALEACQALGDGFANVLVFHSLSKRSNAAGLRCGFVTGDEKLLARFQTFRSFGAAQVPMPLQAGAAALWREETHVEANRALYRSKFDIAERILGGRHGFYRPQGGFFLWLEVGDSEAAARRLWQEAAIKALPGNYIGVPDESGHNPGDGFLRVALVHDDATLTGALERLAQVL
ncbi:MAG TPA: aminotransferase class I/II-fold pyridoxal phosphate-dependent enzyme [Aliidongia sp.]|uniref:aminotransferase class I/II-fold pyridoxal phosphate-dependent enzyme n=1 Tax=Aliidongia sp. TaxID=1914230 RepID=UPI002DDD0C21|nr:aminotransferase class I/II-fold pyridoxal phosphate-dependent enzyme [Aliidongia sp.]HEV2677705.1 aminotransferase class I/II-fold pyridoxal phosphate-dependent enzyme [Aliidongia sp.]